MNLLGFEIDRDFIYFAVDPFSCTTSSYCKFFNVLFAFVCPIFREPKSLQRYYIFLIQQNLVKKLTGFNLSVFPLLNHRRGLFSKASAKLRLLLISTKYFYNYFLPIFTHFHLNKLYTNILTTKNFYVVKHVFNKTTESTKLNKMFYTLLYIAINY